MGWIPFILLLPGVQPLGNDWSNCRTMRYFLLKFPIKIHILYSVRRTYSGLVVMATLAIFPVVPFWFYYKPIQTESGYNLGKTEFGAGNGGLVNEFWIHCILLVAVPFFTIAVLNAMIIYQVMKSNSKMKAHRGSGRYFNLLTPSRIFFPYIVGSIILTVCSIT